MNDSRHKVPAENLVSVWHLEEEHGGAQAFGLFAVDGERVRVVAA